jgi:hypothetical protein
VTSELPPGSADATSTKAGDAIVSLVYQIGPGQLGLWAGVAGIAVGVILVVIDGVAASTWQLSRVVVAGDRSVRKRARPPKV